MINLEKIARKLKQHTIGLELKAYSTIKPFFKNKIGLEIGGPSRIFKANDILPIYTDARQIDGVNFSTRTVWENEIEEGQTYNYDGNQKGHQFIAEASNLRDIADDTYDFLLSSHSLEHCANVIKTVNEWKRVVHSGGVIVVVVPNKQFTFDHKRNVTTFDHLLDDFRNNVDENDLTHLPEIIDIHDLELDPGIESREKFIERSLKNIENRCLHQHVFDIDLLVKVFQNLKMNILITDVQPPFHIIVIVQKL